MKPKANFEISLKHLATEIAAAARKTGSGNIAVSVIMPCFNAADHIQPGLNSLLKQTLPLDQFEVICVDDCSTDNTLDVLHEFASRMPNLRILPHTVNKKQGAARNTGIDAARGKYVFFLDSDDFLRLDALELLLNSAADSDLTICQHTRVRYDRFYKPNNSNRRVLRTIKEAALDGTLGWWPVCMLISREMLNKNKIRFREGVYFEDIDFNVRVYWNVDTFKILKDPLYYYIQRDGSTVSNIDRRKLQDSIAAMAEVNSIALQDANDVVRAAFKRGAESWLKLQIERLGGSDASADVKKEATEEYIKGLQTSGLLAFFPDRYELDLRKMAAAQPAYPAAGSTSAIEPCFSPWTSGLESEFADKVIFFCEVDYHIRSVAPIARELKRLGIESVIVDASRSTSFSANRPMPDHELVLYADLNIRAFNIAKELPFSTEARAFVFSNDTTYTKRLIFENFGYGVPTFGLYEGINDDWNLDRKDPRLPYRSVDHLLLPGLFQAGFYQDRACRIVGLPNVRSRLNAPCQPARARRAIINVNFTYGVLEDRRDLYVESAVKACQEIGLDYIITQHPADKADLSRFNVAKTSVYDLLSEGSVLISRFSTTILEALAMGRPVVYHNPIEEMVPKFKEPLGAYSTSDDVESLKTAIKQELDFVDGGGDVRERAALFLHFHCNTATGEDPALLAACAIAEVVTSPAARFSFKTGATYRQMARPKTLGSDHMPAKKTEPESLDQKLAKHLLMQAAALMLTDKDSFIRQMQDSGFASSLAKAERSRPSDCENLLHFRMVRDHVENKTG
ncbi:MAG: glycosyltransferase [Beijerinckiaceae bacterium]|nr:glycosyltransferase [Beijerinckiaceae bacterium]